MPDPVVDLDRVKSRVYGLEAALAERAVILLDKLSRSWISPYAIYTTSTDLARNDETDLSLTDLYNDQGGPMVVTRARVITTTENTPTAIAATAPYSNLALRVSDVKRAVSLMKDPTLLPTLFSIRDNTWLLDRPHVLHSTHGLLSQVTEQDINATTNIFLTFLGEVVLGGEMSGYDVEEAIALNIYPLPGRQTSVWDQALIWGGLFGNAPPRLKGEAADILDRLRGRVADLREGLRSANYGFYTIVSSVTNLVTDAPRPMSRGDFRQDQGAPFAVHRSRIFTADALAAAAAEAVFQNVSIAVYDVDLQQALTKRDTLAPTLYGRADNAWSFEHPHVLGKNAAFQVDLIGLSTADLTDVYVSFQGEVVEGLSDKDLRSAISLGLYPLMERARN